MRIKALTQICIASGTCAMVAPSVFTQRNSDGVVHVLNGKPEAALIDKLQEAVTNCPSQALVLEDEENITEIIVEEDDESTL